MPKIFISYSHVDQSYIRDIKSVRQNQNHHLHFGDNSLKNPIYNENGHINRRPPNDPSSDPVKREILQLLRDSDKLLVILGNDTHSKLWVEWEIDTFNRTHRNGDILLMRTPDNTRGGAPITAQNLRVHSWDLEAVARWVRS